MIMSLLRHYYKWRNCVTISSLLLIITISLLPIITSLLHHYYVIITSLLRHYYKWRNCVIISLLFHIITLAVSIIVPLLPIITIITYYYMFETGQLADLVLVLVQ